MLAEWSTSGVDLHLDLPAAGGRRTALEAALREAVRTGRLPAGARLPSTRGLAAELGLARGTVTAAYDQLTAEGFLTAQQGAGTVVADMSRLLPAGPPPAEPSPLAAPRYDLRPGRPDVGRFPVAAWLRATRRALSAAPAAAYDYGDPRGHPALRAALAGYLGRARGLIASPEQIVVTTGYVQALALLTALTAGSGRAVAMEDPGPAFHREVVRRHRGEVAALAVDDLGARTDTLPEDRSADVGMVVLTPAHQYPTGVTLHPRRRHAAVAWARACDGLIVEDDYDGEFRYDRQPVGALQGMAPDHVAYVGTASKTLGPAVRLGWLVLPPELVAPVADLKRHTDVHTGVIEQLALAELITSHRYDRHVRASRLRYRRRRDLLTQRLADQYTRWFPVTGVAAGLHALVRLPAPGPGEREVLALADAAGLGVSSLGDQWHRPGDHPQGIVVGYASAGEHAYPAALDTLVRVLRTARAGS